MEMLETVGTVLAVVACGAAWFFMKKKQGASTLSALNSARKAVDSNAPGA